MVPLLYPVAAFVGAALSKVAAWSTSFLVMGFGAFAASSIVPLAKKVLIGLGFGYVVYQGLDIAFDYAKQQIMLSVSGLPADLITIFAWLEIDKMITLIFSAYSIRLALTLGANTGLLRKTQ